MEPVLIKGGAFKDERGRLSYNNGFDASEVCRIYTIENIDTEFVRGWQGHFVEQRWFSAVMGAFEIKLIKIDNWEEPSKSLESKVFRLDSETLDVLHTPAGFISSIRSLQYGSKLLVMADYPLGETNDERRYLSDYFENKL